MNDKRSVWKSTRADKRYLLRAFINFYHRRRERAHPVLAIHAMPVTLLMTMRREIGTLHAIARRACGAGYLSERSQSLKLPTLLRLS